MVTLERTETGRRMIRGENKALDALVAVLTPAERIRIQNRIWKNATAGDGYQPFGYDLPTIIQTMPSQCEAILALQSGD